MVHVLPRIAWLTLALAVGCDGKSSADDSGGAYHFCYQMEDADTWSVSAGGGTGQSGLLIGRVVTDVTEDIHNPNMVANWDYVVENTDVGGTQTRGKTTDSGEFTQTLGAGNWVIEISGQRNGYTCANEIEFEIVAGDTTDMCFDANCR